MAVIKLDLLLSIFLLTLLSSACQVTEPSSYPPPPTVGQTEGPVIETMSGGSSPSIQGFPEFVAKVEESPKVERQGLVNSYTANLERGPLVEGTRVLFLYRGEGYKVQLVGDMNNWNLEKAPNLSRAADTDLWFYIDEYQSDARLDYNYLIDDRSLVNDPFNPRITKERVGQNSTLIMPDYQDPQDSLSVTEEIPTGALATHTIESQYLNEVRTFFVYEPPGQIIGERLPTVYINDGSDYLNIINAPLILDRLIASRLIPPIFAVFIPPIDRSSEYSADDSYARFLAKEVVPFVQSNYPTDADPRNIAVVGSSLGGTAAVFTALAHPEIFGSAGSFSAVVEEGSNPLIDQDIIGDAELAAERQRTTPIRLFLVVGSYETEIEIEGERRNILAGNREFAEALRELGHNVSSEERAEGHSWGLWEAAFVKALQLFFSR